MTELAATFGRYGQEYVQDSWGWDKAVARLENHLLATAGRDT